MQIRRKFGEIPTGLQERLSQLSTPQLAELGEALLDFKLFNELEARLQNRA